MNNDIRKKLAIEKKRLDEINNFLIDPNNKLITDILNVVEKYGTPSEINKKSKNARKIENLMSRLSDINSPYINDLEWLIKQKNNNSFISVDEYIRKILGDKINNFNFNKDFSVTLEISACQYFPFFMKQAHQALLNKELMPGRFIRVRNMKEQEKDNDLLAMTAAMQIIGASWCETLDTKGTDGSNIHLGGPDTIT